jgi:predicted membrane protein
VVSLEVNSVFGGVEIIVPGNWRVQNDITAVLGGVSDRRPFVAGDADKVLRIHGSAVFGGVEVK